MKKFTILALVLVLTMTALTGCRKADTNVTTTPSTTAPTTKPTVPPTTVPPTTLPRVTTEPTMMDILPDAADTIDPSSGANQR